MSRSTVTRTLNIVIEYHGPHAFAVVQREFWDHSKEPWFDAARHRAKGTSIAHHDLEYSRLCDQVYAHLSGSGPDETPYRHVLGKFVEPGIHATIYAHPSVQLCKRVQRRGEWINVPLKEHELAAYGYRRIKLPRLLKNSWGDTSRDPLKIAEEGEVVYCPECEDWLPDDTVTACGHLRWCNECSVHVSGVDGLTINEPREKCEHQGDQD